MPEPVHCEGGSRPGLISTGYAWVFAVLMAAIASPGQAGVCPDTLGSVPTPNVLLIISDDLGKDATPGYAVGAQKAKMPVLEGLMAQGLTFENLWVSPVCSPTRAAMLTGRHGVHTGVLTPGGAIQPTETIIHRYLSHNTAYSTAIIGKWHLTRPPGSGGASPHTHPNQMGVPFFSGLTAGGGQNFYNWPHNENGQTSTSTVYETTFITDKAIEWIGLQERREKPWFLWLAHTAPHFPFHVPPSDLHDRDSLSGTTQDINANPLPYFLAAAEALDKEMGRLLEFVDMENTVVIYIGDNGTDADVAQEPFIGKAKATVYQGGVNTPMVVAGAGVTRSGEREDALITATDMFATIADFAGTGLTQIHSSRSFRGLLSSPDAPRRTFAYTDNSYLTSAWAIRDSKYKLIHFLANGDEEFYNLEADPFEQTNLMSGEMSGEAGQALSRLRTMADSLRSAN